MVVVTHYQRLLNYIVPDFVHVLVDGRIVRSGGKEMALELEEKGYAWLEKEPPAARGRRGPLVTPMNAVLDERDALRSSFERFTAAHAASDPAWLRDAPRGGLRALRREGAAWPARRGVAPHADRVRSSARASSRPTCPGDRSLRPSRSCRRDGLDGASIVFVNGRFAPELSRSGPAGAGVEVSSLREVLREEPARSEPWLGRVLASAVAPSPSSTPSSRRTGPSCASRPAPSSSSRSTWCTSPPRMARPRSPTCARSSSPATAASRVSSRASSAPTAAATSSTR